MKLDLNDIEIHYSSYVDPNGFVFTYRGELYRGLRKDAAGLFRALLEDGTLRYLSRGHNLVPVQETDLSIPEAGCDFVLKPSFIRPEIYCLEWCPSMMKKAAEAVLDLNMALLERDCMLQDAYPWNILFDAGRPVHVDVTSIVPAGESDLLWPAFQQFMNFFLHPLKLSAMGKGNIARLLLQDYLQGITLSELNRHRTLGYSLRHPLQTSMDHLLDLLDRKFQDSSALRTRIRRPPSVPAGSSSMKAVRRRFLTGLSRKISAIEISHSRDHWKGYYSETEDFRQGCKLETVDRLLDSLRPEWVLDAGCNVGRFSVVAARKGARVIALDRSEACLDSLFRYADAQGLNIVPVVADLLNPTPSFGFLSRQFPPLVARVEADVVLCLALMHHLHVIGRQSFERIADLLNRLSRRAVIFEYVDPADNNILRLDAGRKIDYSLESVSRELSRHFRLSFFESDRETRRIILCEK